MFDDLMRYLAVLAAAGAMISGEIAAVQAFFDVTEYEVAVR